MTAYGISRWAYEELRAFCRQYPEKKAKAAALLGIQGGSRVQEAKDEHGDVIGVVAPSAKGVVSDQVSRAAERRERLLEDCALVEKAAKNAAGGKFKTALILNCCYGTGYEYLDPGILPNAKRNTFFRARREFFWILYHEKYGDR